MTSYYLPRLKSLVEYCSIEDKIYFFNKPGKAIVLDDPSKFIATTCNLMDGKTNLDQIKQTLALTHRMEVQYLDELLSVLDNEFLLEDSFFNSPDGLTDYELTRWSRNIEFFGAYSNSTINKYSYQKKLKTIKVVILGLGGVGSNILYNLVAMGYQNICIVDYDRVELSNLNRQILYNESDIGILKTIAAKNRIHQFYPDANIEVINKKISSSRDIENIIFDSNIVINAIDHPREQIMDWVNKACVKCNIPFICGALDSRWAIYYSVVPGLSGCIECWKTNARKSGFIFQDLIKNKEFIKSPALNVTIVPFVSIIAGLIVSEVLKITTGIEKPVSQGNLRAFDFINAEITAIECWNKNENCTVCSNIIYKI